MRITALLILLVASNAAVQAEKYSVRDIGFTDFETQPYRIVMVANDVKAIDVVNQQMALRKELEHANVTLTVYAADSKELVKELKPVKPPENVTKPLYWVLSPNQISSLEPTRSLKDLLDSPVRKALHEKMTHALCAVLLVESKDDDANKKAKAKAEKVIAQINEVQHRFEKSPHHEIELVTLTVAERSKERWTLWALDEKEEAPEKPKVGVIYGKLRRAGAFFEGTDWKEDDLFARIAILGQHWDGDARGIVAGPMLPFVWSAKLELDIDPVKEAAEIKAMLDRPPVKAPKKRLLSYPDYHVPPVAQMHGAQEPAPRAEVSAEPLFIASTTVGMVFLIIGILGWLALGACVWKLEQKQAHEAKPT